MLSLKTSCICFIYLLTVLFEHVQTTDFEENGIVFKENVDCRTLGEVYLNGTEWTPLHRSTCMKCSCLNGNADCNWIDCVAEGINCKVQRAERSECCRICRRNRIEGKRGKRVRRSCAPRRKKKKKGERTDKKERKNRKGSRRNRKSRRRNRRRKNRQSSDVGSITSTVASTIERGYTSRPNTLPNIFKSSPTEPLQLSFFKTGLCMPDNADKVIYRHYEKRHGIYIAFDDLVSNHVEVLWWSLTKGMLGDMQILKYPADEFRRNITIEAILGSTTNSEIKTFTRRLTRQMGICAKRNKCRSKVIKRAFFCFEMKNVYFNCNERNN